MKNLIEKIKICVEDCDTCEFIYPIPESFDISYCDLHENYLKYTKNKLFFVKEVNLK